CSTHPYYITSIIEVVFFEILQCCLVLGGFLCVHVLGAIRATSAEQTEIVNKHNTLRRGVNPTASNMMKMSWNKEAAANAQAWAATCSMQHSSSSSREITSGCGENLYMSSSKNTWSNAIQTWYNEVKDYRYGVGSTNGGVVGHYTQVVWAKSNQVGCAMAYCPNSKYKYFYVCHYCPPSEILLLPSLHFSLILLLLFFFQPNDQYSNCPELKQQ
uniref:Cysteine rich secretory protein 3 n=1 Tax=Cyprinodon variegatus TaxID=28743 RepID=A0A3Q2DQD9_CYPVA